ncbi:efflux RND transporter periplasmic adaptor subunit [Paraflavitalea sp. CAU 1676]|uniref:efflux RND transporter periplasmic adaptor subunit n=1 Tax=Paraflavitalea sp. CAU 1676 TaxID=3032598 RepID=UPI0023DB2107|nr:efflux RND transporter periplasmic adaptor subunit [Paraflavitalea sp. CAU 1676]MDF2191656.1 efflux RND transporter periplasmic adaptor subunit [Paraflavitalea sp. CAU 1676]
MERKQFLKSLALVSMVPAVLLEACAPGKKEPEAQAAPQKTYTCPMHPQVVQNKPGTCPICGMDLVPIDKSSKEAGLELSDSQAALANITTMTVGAGALSTYRELNGRLVTDPQQTSFISSRVAGRIEALYVKETGIVIRKGQPLYKIYSEQLTTLQQEFLLAAAQAKQFPDDPTFARIEKAARQKLLLYDQTAAAIGQLAQTQKTSPYITYPAPSGGTVAEIAIAEGQYVTEGANLLRLEGYNALWVEADLYPAEAAAVKTGQQLQVTIPGWENDSRTMQVQFINPAYENGTQLTRLRGTIVNPTAQWQPGLQAIVQLPVSKRTDALRLPVDAVIRDGKGSHVWKETSKRKYQPVMVNTGIEDDSFVEITEGIQPGDKIVVTGAYLLYSEYILKKGVDPMAAHNH